MTTPTPPPGKPGDTTHGQDVPGRSLPGQSLPGQSEPGRTGPVGWGTAPAAGGGGGNWGGAGTGGWGAAVPPRPAGKPSQGKAWLTHGAVGLVALFVGVGIGSGGETADASAGGGGRPRPAVTTTVTETAEAEPAPTVTKTVTAKPKKTEKEGPASSFAGDGEYLVGKDIAPGTYRTAGADSFGCYWARLKDASGELGAIIANNNLEGPGHVTVNKGEYFETKGCRDWKKVG
ncbi:hypothetical protein [Streptomyces sp. HB2AG]|uniref:hypothetical protein n=1 Tax=Streptomyces sp. HB2AG TaxID=2983400 RepID=UPI0022AA5E61|nr:hypothetical protein [Streptomyces sp. HB2AG]MCZ2525383.1 hypothetical protein [Streptomyces sp. HB2AG]